MMGKSAFFREGTAGQMKRVPSFAKDDDSTLPKEPNGSKIVLGPKPIWECRSVDIVSFRRTIFRVRIFLGMKMTDKRLPCEANWIPSLGKQPGAKK
jgi:hypothetical protein